MEALPLLLSKQCRSQEMLCNLTATFLSRSLKCRGCRHLTLSWLTPCSILNLLCWKFLLFCSFQTLLTYDMIFLCCFHCCYLALRILAWFSSCCRFPLFYQNSYFLTCHLVPASTQEAWVLGLVPRAESQAKAIVLVITTELEAPVSWGASGEMAGKDQAQIEPKIKLIVNILRLIDLKQSL